MFQNYLESGMETRGFLIRIPLVALYELENDKWPLDVWSYSEKEKVKGILQIDIISKLMMYIEDLVVIAESCRQNLNYYELLDQKKTSDDDVGKIIENFFLNLSNFTDDDICKMMGWKIISETKLSTRNKKFLKKIYQGNITETRRKLKIISEFGKMHHPVFRRFKHGGSPLTPGLKANNSKVEELDKFDSFTRVSNGPDPLKDILMIPFSKDIIKSYKIIASEIQQLLGNILENKLSCMEHNLDGIISPLTLTPLSKKHRVELAKIIISFFKKHPRLKQPNFDFDAILKRKDIQWYLDVDDFIKEYQSKVDLDIFWAKSWNREDNLKSF